MDKLNKYKIIICEILSKEIEVEAKTKEQALSDVKKMYCESKIILDSDDFQKVCFRGVKI